MQVEVYVTRLDDFYQLARKLFFAGNYIIEEWKPSPKFASSGWDGGDLIGQLPEYLSSRLYAAHMLNSILLVRIAWLKDVNERICEEFPLPDVPVDWFTTCRAGDVSKAVHLCDVCHAIGETSSPQLPMLMIA